MKLQRTSIIIISILTLLLVGAGVFWCGMLLYGTRVDPSFDGEGAMERELSSGGSMNASSNDSWSNDSVNSKWISASMELSGVGFLYPKGWYVASQGSYPFGSKSADHIMIRTNKTEKEGYFCIDFRGYPRDGYVSDVKHAQPEEKVEQIQTRSGLLELVYSGENDSVAQMMVTAHMLVNDRNVSISALFNCAQSDDSLLADKHEKFFSRPEIDVMKEILETLKY